MEPVGYIIGRRCHVDFQDGIAYGMKAECCVSVEPMRLMAFSSGSGGKARGAQRAGWPMQKNGHVLTGLARRLIVASRVNWNIIDRVGTGLSDNRRNIGQIVDRMSEVRFKGIAEGRRRCSRTALHAAFADIFCECRFCVQYRHRSL